MSPQAKTRRLQISAGGSTLGRRFVSDPNGNRTHIQGEAHELAEQYEHARPLPLRRPPPLTEVDQAYRNGCIDTANAVRISIAAELERRGQDLAALKNHEAEAAELFVQAARIRSAVKL